MNKINDNIGGFGKIEFLSSNNIQYMPYSVPVSASLKSGATWTNIPMQYGTSTIESPPTRTSAGLVFDHKVNILIAECFLTEELKSKIQELAFHGGIIRYRTNNDQSFIIGTKEYPLQALIETRHPGVVSGFSCLRLELSGKSPYSQLLEKV